MKKMKITVSKKMLKMFEEAGEFGEFITGMESLQFHHPEYSEPPIQTSYLLAFRQSYTLQAVIPKT